MNVSPFKSFTVIRVSLIAAGALLFNVTAFAGGTGGGGGATINCPGRAPVLIDVALKAPQFQDTSTDTPIELSGLEYKKLEFQTIRALDLPAGQRLAKRLKTDGAAHISTMQLLIEQALKELKFRFVKKVVPTTYQFDNMDLSSFKCPIVGVAYYSRVFEVLVNVDGFNAMGDRNREALVARETLRRVQRTYEAITSTEKIYDLVGVIEFDDLSKTDLNAYASGLLSERLNSQHDYLLSVIKQLRGLWQTVCQNETQDEKITKSCQASQLSNVDTNSITMSQINSKANLIYDLALDRKSTTTNPQTYNSILEQITKIQMDWSWAVSDFGVASVLGMRWAYGDYDWSATDSGARALVALNDFEFDLQHPDKTAKYIPYFKPHKAISQIRSELKKVLAGGE